jgi:hypothetical protein
VGALVLAYLRSRMTREIRPIYLAGQEPDAVLVGAPSTGDAVDTVDAVDAVDADTDDAPPAELAELPEPTDAWSDLRSALRSGWLTPGAAWLGLDQDDAEDEIEDDAADDAADEDADEDALTPEVTEVTEVTGASAAASTPRGHTPDGAGGQA